MTFDWQNNPDLEFRTLRTHFTKDFLYLSDPKKRLKIFQPGVPLHAFTDRGFQDVRRELPLLQFPEGKEITKEADQHFVMDLPAWGEARIEDDGKTIRIYDKKGIPIYRFSDLFVIGKNKKPFKITDKNGHKIREAEGKGELSPAEMALLDNRIERNDDAENADWQIENQKLFVRIPKLRKNSYPLKVFDNLNYDAVNNKDTWVRTANPDTNYGNDTFARYGYYNGDIRRFLIHFTLPSGSGDISNVEIALYHFSAYTGSKEVRLMNSTSWSETGATWNNYGGLAATTYDTKTNPADGWTLWVITGIPGIGWGSEEHLGFKSQLENFNDAAVVYTKENGAYVPYIVITYTPSSTNWEKTLTESATFTASFIKGAQRILSENLSFTDVLAKVRGISRVLSESSSFAATLTRGIGKIWNEAASFGDTLVKGTGKILIELTESVSFADSLTRSAGKIFLESKTFTASMIRDLAKTFSESASFADNLAKGAGKILAEAVSFSDILIRSTQKIFAETTNFNDQCFRIISRTLGETAGFSATIIRSAARTLNETISFSAALSKGIVKTFSGTAVFGATFLRSISRTFAEIPHFAAVITRSVSRIFSETATFAASLIKSPVKTLTGSATFTDSIRRSIARTLTESVGFIASIRLYLNGLTAGIWARTKRTKDSWTKTGREL